MIYSQHFILMVRVLFGMSHFRRMRILLEAKKRNHLKDYFETLYSVSLRIILELRGAHITEQKNMEGCEITTMQIQHSSTHRLNKWPILLLLLLLFY